MLVGRGFARELPPLTVEPTGVWHPCGTMSPATKAATSPVVRNSRSVSMTTWTCPRTSLATSAQGRRSGADIRRPVWPRNLRPIRRSIRGWAGEVAACSELADVASGAPGQSSGFVDAPLLLRAYPADEFTESPGVDSPTC